MNRIIIALAAIAMVVGCAKDGATEALSSDSVAQFTTESAVTRVVTSTTTTDASTWETNDFIGISSDNGDTNVKYVAAVVGSVVSFTANDSSETILLPRNKTVKYRAYYPWQDATTYTSDLTDQSDLGAIDFMTAAAVESIEGGSAVNFAFSHKLAMAKFTITLEEDLEAKYPDWKSNFTSCTSKLTLEDAVTKATYKLTGDYLENYSEIGDIDVPISTTGVATAILNDTMSTAYMTLSVVVDGTIYETKFSCTSNGGMIYNYAVTLGYKGISVTQTSIEAWKDYDFNNSGKDELGQTTETSNPA